jgi:hypothetical protein
MRPQIHIKRDKKPEGKDEEEIEMNYHQFKHRGFLLNEKSTWTDLLRVKEDKDYEIEEIF